MTYYALDCKYLPIALKNCLLYPSPKPQVPFWSWHKIWNNGDSIRTGGNDAKWKIWLPFQKFQNVLFTHIVTWLSRNYFVEKYGKQPICQFLLWIWLILSWGYQKTWNTQEWSNGLVLESKIIILFVFAMIVMYKIQ